LISERNEAFITSPFFKGKTMKLSVTQTNLLTAAAQHPEHLLTDFPANLKGGARLKVLTSLANANLIAAHSQAEDGTTQFAITDAGRSALGIAIEAKATPSKREGTKQATLIELLQRPEGATLEQMVQATGWQQHTVRGCMAGALKKKLGLSIVSEKADGQQRTYRIA
jgi:uncharacterized protein (DUF1778 family)